MVGKNSQCCPEPMFIVPQNRTLLSNGHRLWRPQRTPAAILPLIGHRFEGGHFKALTIFSILKIVNLTNCNKYKINNHWLI